MKMTSDREITIARYSCYLKLAHGALYWCIVLCNTIIVSLFKEKYRENWIVVVQCDMYNVTNFYNKCNCINWASRCEASKNAFGKYVFQNGVHLSIIFFFCFSRASHQGIRIIFREKGCSCVVQTSIKIFWW